MRALSGEPGTRVGAAAVVAVAAALSLAACGVVGSGGSERSPVAAPASSAAPAAVASPAGEAATAADAAAITELTRFVALSESGVGALCRDKLSAKFVTRVFHTVKRCEHSVRPDAPDNRTQDVTVSDLRVSGPAATATVTEVGGEWAGARGTWAFIRVGQGWHVAAWGVDYLRSALKAQFTTGYHPRGDGDLISDPTVRGCLSDTIQKLDDSTLTDLAFGLFRGDKSVLRTYRTYQDECELVPGPDGLSALRRNFDAGLKAGATKAGNGAIADCVSQRLRTTVSDRALQNLVNSGRPVGDFPKRIAREIAAAGQACAATLEAGGPTRSA